MATEISHPTTLGAARLAVTSIRHKQTHFLTRPFADETEAAQAKAVLGVASEPACDRTVAKRVVSLLNHYFVSPLPAGQAADVANDWLEIIGNPPEWALHDACIWWIGPNNPNCARKPLPGQIAARIKTEMEPIRTAEIALQRHENGQTPLRVAAE